VLFVAEVVVLLAVVLEQWQCWWYWCQWSGSASFINLYSDLRKCKVKDYHDVDSDSNVKAEETLSLISHI